MSGGDLYIEIIILYKRIRKRIDTYHKLKKFMRIFNPVLGREGPIGKEGQARHVPGN